MFKVLSSHSPTVLVHFLGQNVSSIYLSHIFLKKEMKCKFSFAQFKRERRKDCHLTEIGVAILSKFVSIYQSQSISIKC